MYDSEVPQTTALSYSEHAIVLNSFSKYYSRPGWRLGWMVVPDYLAEPITHLAHNLYICPPAASQIGALAALDCRGELDDHVARYRRNRDLLLHHQMPRLGFDRFTATRRLLSLLPRAAPSRRQRPVRDRDVGELRGTHHPRVGVFPPRRRSLPALFLRRCDGRHRGGSRSDRKLARPVLALNALLGALSDSNRRQTPALSPPKPRSARNR